MIIDIDSNFEAYDANTHRRLVNFRWLMPDEAKIKMDETIVMLRALGYVVNDNREANEIKARRDEHTDHDYSRIDEEKR